MKNIILIHNNTYLFIRKYMNISKYVLKYIMRVLNISMHRLIKLNEIKNIFAYKLLVLVLELSIQFS